MKLALGYIWTQAATTKHKALVAYYMLRFAINRRVPLGQWLLRALRHDLSKYRWVEARGFAETIFELRKTPYGSDEYRALLKRIKPSIEAHYKVNSHHPEYWGGYAAMPMLDRMEMLCDWAAAVRRHDDGCIARSIALNAERWGYDQLEAKRLRDWAATIGARVREPQG